MRTFKSSKPAASKRVHIKAWLGASALAVVISVALPANSALFAQETAALANPAADFEQSFEPFETVPAAAAPAPNAVDITDIKAAPEPASDVRSDLGSGVASFYGKAFAGRKTASGESFNPRLLTAAHKTLPFGSKVRVTNPRNGKTVVVRINDRGPYAHGRSIDLSRAAAEQIGIVGRGRGTVEMALLAG